MACKEQLIADLTRRTIIVATTLAVECWSARPTGTGLSRASAVAIVHA